MFKLVVLCAFLAAAIADPEPGAIFAPLGAPLAYSSTIVSPASTTITKSASSVVHPSPYLYSAPLAYTHFIKKRSAPLALASGYYAPNAYIAPSTYVSSPLAYSTPLVNSWSTPLAYSAPAHFIKKRSAPLLTNTFITPTTYAATAPLLTSTYHATPVIASSPLYTAGPLAYSHFIKKRSTPFVLPGSYISPATYAAGTPLFTSTYAAATPYIASAPLISSSPFGYTQFIKK